MLDGIFRILPQVIAKLIASLPLDISRTLEEIRIREYRPLEIIYSDQYRFVSKLGELVERPEQAFCPSKEDCVKLIDLLSNHSLYTMEEQLRRGFITVRGGHRVGIAGKVVLDKGSIRHIRDITCFNIRIAREIPNIGTSVLPYLLDMPLRSIHQTLIVSPPQQGKTTLLRDLARLISYGTLTLAFPWSGLKVAIVDERSELAACIDGVPSFDMGPRTDVLDACPKAEGMMMMIRSMSPDVIVVDEIGSEQDASSIHEAMYAGIRVLATAHGRDIEDILRKPVLRELLDEQLFTRIVVLGKRSGTISPVQVYDRAGRRLLLPAPD
jgi:stage III sporulation protein AA